MNENRLYEMRARAPLLVPRRWWKLPVTHFCIHSTHESRVIYATTLMRPSPPPAIIHYKCSWRGISIEIWQFILDLSFCKSAVMAPAADLWDMRVLERGEHPGWCFFKLTCYINNLIYFCLLKIHYHHDINVMLYENFRRNYIHCIGLYTYARILKLSGL